MKLWMWLWMWLTILVIGYRLSVIGYWLLVWSHCLSVFDLWSNECRGRGFGFIGGGVGSM